MNVNYTVNLTSRNFFIILITVIVATVKIKLDQYFTVGIWQSKKVLLEKEFICKQFSHFEVTQGA